MAVTGILTNAGLAQTQLAALNQGWYIYPSGFGVSSAAGPLDPTRTAPNASNWYGTPSQPGPISGRVVENFNTIKFICTIPPGEEMSVTNVNEIYLYTAGYASLNYDGVTYTALTAGTIGNSITLVFNGSSTNQQIVNNWNTSNPSNQVAISSGPSGNISPSNTFSLAGGGNTVLFAIGEASPTIQYDPTGQLTLELTIGVLNSNLTSQIVFDYTQATEVADHNVDPLAHPDLQQALALAAIFPTAGANPFSYSGQIYDQLAVFDGTPATASYLGVTYTAVRNGPLGNSISLVFDGILTINTVVYNWNLNNPDNAVMDNAGNGNVVPAAGTINLSGGTLSVNDGDVVYSDNGVYKQALADGSAKSNVAGIVNLTYNKVMAIGYIAITTGYPVGTILYLSATTPGAITSTISTVQIATQIYSSPDVILFISHGSSSGSFAGYAAVVTDTPGINNYTTTQAAINAVSSGSSILVDKLEVISTEILTNNKQLNFYFLGPETGWTNSIPLQEIQLISFNSLPASGTWRIYWNGFEGPDLAYNASALDVQTVFENFGQAGMVVTGNYTSGFTLTYPNYSPEPLPVFTNVGQNAIQQIVFSQVPTNGCFQIEFLNNPSYTTAFFCYDNTLAQLQSFTDTVLGAGNAVWSGSFSAGFTIQYQSSLGIQPIALLQILNNGMVNGVTPVTITPSSVQSGDYPASNLYNSLSQLVTITPSEIQEGAITGPVTAIQLTENNCNFFNNGLISNFTNGIDFNGTVGHHIEITFKTVTQPVLSYSFISSKDFSVDGSVGAANSDIPSLRVVQHPTNSNRIVITGVDYSDFQGGVLSQVLNNQLLVFSGIQIDFNTGVIYASDGVTVIGGFTPVTLTTGQYVWYALALQPGATNADNTVGGSVQIIPGLANSSLSAANKPTFSSGTIPLAFVYNQQGSSQIDPVLQTNVYEVSISAASVYTPANVYQPFFQQEIPSGIINGSNVVFAISQDPKTILSLLVFIDGIPIPSNQWSLTGTTLTLTSAPAIGQDIYVYYVTNSPNSVYGYQETPSGAVNGVNNAFALSEQPSSQNSLLVFVDGVSVDTQNWSLVQMGPIASIEFNAGFIPQTGQDVYAFYLINLFAVGPTPIIAIQSEGAGVPIYDKTVAGISYIKSLINGSNVEIIDNGEGGIVISSTGGGGGGAGAWTYLNSQAGPYSVVSSGFTPSSGITRQIWFVTTAGGIVTVSGTPQIAAGTIDGQEMILKGTSDVNYPIFTASTGLDLNGPCSLTSNQALYLIWSETGNFWWENSRRA